MTLFKNVNGTTYQVLTQCGDYALLKDTVTNEYVLVFNLNEELGYWSSGYYTYDLEIAMNRYQERTNDLDPYYEGPSHELTVDEQMVIRTMSKIDEGTIDELINILWD